MRRGRMSRYSTAPRGPRARSVVAVPVVAAMLLASCSSDAPTSAGVPGAAAITTPEPAAPADSGATAEPAATTDSGGSGGRAGSGEVPAVLRWSAPLLGGGELSGADLGDRPLVLWFWAPT